MKPVSLRSRTALGAAVAGLCATAQVGWGAELSYGVDAGVGYSDNIAKVADDKQGETIATVGAQMRLDHESKRLSAKVATRFEYRDYLDNSFDSEVIGNLIGNAVLDLVEERLTWTVDDTFGQTTANQFAPATPDNRENVNHLSTGPDFTLPLGSRNKLLVHGRYVDVHYEDNALGNNRIRGELALLRELSDASSVSINATSERVSYDDEAQFVEFDHNEAFLSYNLQAARTSLSIEAGATEIRAAGQSNDSWLGRVEMTRQASPSLNVGLEVGHDFSDAGSAFAQVQSLQPGSVDPVPVQQTATPFENNYGAVFARFSRNRTGLQLRLGYTDEGYDAQPLFDRKRISLDLSLQRSLNSYLSAHVSTNYSRQEFEELDRKFADISATLGLRWGVSRTSFVSVDYRYLDRNDDQSGADFRANELWVRFAYLVGDNVAAGGFGGP
ncbi:MAG: outer membrane beta-barrel protein [Pseudomonadota bacterium]